MNHAITSDDIANMQGQGSTGFSGSKDFSSK